VRAKKKHKTDSDNIVPVLHFTKISSGNLAVVAR